MVMWVLKRQEFRVVEVEAQVLAPTREEAVAAFEQLMAPTEAGPELEDTCWLSEVLLSSTPCSAIEHVRDIHACQTYY